MIFISHILNKNFSILNYPIIFIASCWLIRQLTYLDHKIINEYFFTKYLNLWGPEDPSYKMYTIITIIIFLIILYFQLKFVFSRDVRMHSFFCTFKMMKYIFLLMSIISAFAVLGSIILGGKVVEGEDYYVLWHTQLNFTMALVLLPDLFAKMK